MRNNLADGAGIRLVFEAYKLAAKNDPSVPGYSQYNGAQSLFISYGAVSSFSPTYK
jgi:predicted metalloendopeptidase